MAHRRIDVTPTRRILGIDPGLNITGYAVIDQAGGKLTLVEAGVVRGKTKGSLTARLKEIHQGVLEVVRALKPHVLAIEQLYSHYERPRTAILMGHARGVICLVAALEELELKHYAATQVKRTLTGNGRAPKVQMQNAICREFGLLKPPEPPDVADALAVALCHCHWAKESARLSLARPSRIENELADEFDED